MLEMFLPNFLKLGIFSPTFCRLTFWKTFSNKTVSFSPVHPYRQTSNSKTKSV